MRLALGNFGKGSVEESVVPDLSLQNNPSVVEFEYDNYRVMQESLIGLIHLLFYC